MVRVVLWIYGWMRRHAVTGFVTFAVVTALLAVWALSMNYKEDIRDFLPFDDDNATAMEVYQNITGADRIYAFVSAADGRMSPDALIDAAARLVEEVEERDSLGYVSDITGAVDDDMIEEVTGRLYSVMPMLLDSAGYAEVDSLLGNPGEIDSRIAEAREMLSMPSSGMVSAWISHDPLSLFGVVMGRLQAQAPSTMFNTYDGYVMTADGTDVIVSFRSAFGANETDFNGRLVDMLEDAASATERACEGIAVTVVGAPVIAVGNARRIKHDSLLSIAVASLLIVALLVYVFRSARNITLIFISVGWGWLFAMGVIAMFSDSVSIIVVGIASVMLGIAVNYPLHLVEHLDGMSDRMDALREIVAPLVIGNVTTVGAFLCLVPLDSPALHDLGLFSSVMLVGTILFVLIFLPHCVKRVRQPGGTGKVDLISRLASFEIKPRRSVLAALVVLTAVFAFFSTRVGFDADLRDINYITDDQRALFDRLNHSLDGDSIDGGVYVAACGDTWDEAASLYEQVATNSGVIVSGQTQRSRLELWRHVREHRDELTAALDEAGRRYGFSECAFDRFKDILDREYVPAGEEELAPLARLFHAGRMCEVDGRYIFVDVRQVPQGADKESYMSTLRREVPPGVIVFDVGSMGREMTGKMSADFNYIGLVCGSIVFLFLWLSMGSIRLALISFAPMAVGWIWIIGIMGLFGLHFNIVNIILATFIFGQGDDYTIFITEGLCYERREGRKVLPKFKRSIMVSALIMLAGIGVLVFATHPALRSLGQVAVIGMFTVVFMAYVIPPLLFRIVMRK